MVANRGLRVERERGVLPGWEVEARPRTNERYEGKIDSFYYEPVRGKQYRSWTEAWARYEETKQENDEGRKPNKEELARMKKKTEGFEVAKSPESVTWVLTDIENDKWTPYVGNEMVSEAEQKLWEDTFELAMLWDDWPGFGANAE